MREIKFRAWNPRSECFLYWKDIMLHKRIMFNDSVKWMQYTGLKDKNGVEIYERDVVKNHWTDINGKDIGRLWEVKFGDHETSNDYYASGAYGWYGDTNTGEEASLAQIPYDTGEGLEVMGNIYENPKIMEAK